MSPKSPSFPARFTLSLVCTKEEGRPLYVRGSTDPTHLVIDKYIDAIAELGELLGLEEGELRVNTSEQQGSVRFSSMVSDRPIRRLLAQLTLIGNDDLCEVRRQVEGYPYEAIATLYAACVMQNALIRRNLPVINLNTTPMLALNVAEVLGGPATTICIGVKKDTLTLRGLPFNQPFARLVNDEILRRTKNAIKPHLPIIGRPDRRTKAGRLLAPMP